MNQRKTKADYYNRQRLNLTPSYKKSGFKEFHPMNEVEYEPPKINMHHHVGEGIVTKGVLIPAYAISIYLLILAIACMIASFSWCTIQRNKKAQVYLGLFSYDIFYNLYSVSSQVFRFLIL